jgi:hypothetical protein
MATDEAIIANMASDRTATHKVVLCDMFSEVNKYQKWKEI